MPGGENRMYPCKKTLTSVLCFGNGRKFKVTGALSISRISYQEE